MSILFKQSIKGYRFKKSRDECIPDKDMQEVWFKILHGRSDYYGGRSKILYGGDKKKI